MDSQYALIIVETALANSIHTEIDRLSFGDALAKQRIVECYTQLPNKDCLSPSQLELLAWVIKTNSHRIPDNSPKKKPTAIEGLLSLALAECNLVCNALTHDDPIEAQTLLTDAAKNLARAQEEIEKEALSYRRGKCAADAKHNKPGGSREKNEKIRNIWATGKYTSRDICAEQECAGLDMSFSAARKALRNT